MALAGQEKRQVAQPTECEAAMSRWKAAPSVMQYMVVDFRADLECNKLVIWCAGLGLASCDEVGSWPSDSVFDKVRDEECKDQ